METISLIEAALLECRGAEQRLAVARQALQDFDLEFANRAGSSELHESLAHQRCVLEVEVDSARRRHAECLAQYTELKNTGGACIA